MSNCDKKLFFCLNITYIIFLCCFTSGMEVLSFKKKKKKKKISRARDHYYHPLCLPRVPAQRRHDNITCKDCGISISKGPLLVSSPDLPRKTKGESGNETTLLHGHGICNNYQHNYSTVLHVMLSCLPLCRDHSPQKKC